MYSREACQALSEDVLIKRLQAANHSTEIWQKAVDVLSKRIASRQVSDDMLLRIIVSLAKSTACFEVHRRPRRRRS
jgi:hypothetical protein